MDKSKIAVIVIAVVMLILVVCVLGVSKTPEMKRNEYLKLEDVIYTTEDVENYILIKNEDAGDIAKVLTIEEKEEQVNNFMADKLYASAADKKGITVPETEIEKFKKDYAEKTLLGTNGITEEEYIEYASDDYKANQLTENFGDYYELPEEMYDSVIEGLEDPMKSYSFRIMTFYYEEPESGETSGDISGDKLRDAVYAEAEAVRAKVLSGESFEELAKNHSTYRYTFKGVSYTLVNGDVEYATSLLLQDKLGSEALYNAVKDLGSGDCSELVEDEEQNVINFVKVETVEDGFTGEADKELREILLYQVQESLVLEDVHAHTNQDALIDLLY